MRILAIDTSTSKGSIALLDSDKQVWERKLDLELSHTERLLPAIEGLLEEAGAGILTLDGLAVGIGPGSFTGLRIGLATMKAFAQAGNLPLVGVSTLEAMAHNVAESKEPVAAVLDAKRKEIFLGLYQFENGKLKETLLKEQVLKPEEAATILKSWGTVRFVGDALQTYPQTFIGILEKNSEIKASWIGKLALPRLKLGDGKEGLSLTPNYIRKSDAEIKK